VSDRGGKAKQPFSEMPVRVVAVFALAVRGTAHSVPSWGVQVTPNPAGATRSFLDGVACPSATACTAVGRYLTSSGTYLTLADRWDGQRWAIRPTPNPPTVCGSGLLAVARPSVTDRTAVGDYWDGSDQQAFAEHWDGTSWALQQVAGPSGATFTFLTGGACPSRMMCQAIGYAGASAGRERWVTLAEQWDGRTWAAEPTQDPAGALYNNPAGVACSSAEACTAVGLYIYKTVPLRP
jgi:hypothetical protein